MKEKITAEEIQQLRENAEKERGLHQKIMHVILALRGIRQPDGTFPSMPLSPEEQMLILRRGREDEVVEMLQAYAETDWEKVGSCCTQAQIYIYEQARKGGMTWMKKANLYMLENCLLTPQFEKHMIDTVWNIELSQIDSLWSRRKKTPEAEVYMIMKTLQDIQRQGVILTIETQCISTYVADNQLSPEGEEALMKFINLGQLRKVVKDKLRGIVLQYIKTYPLSSLGQEALVATQDHNLIMEFIVTSPKSFTSSTAVALLVKRAIRTELVAFFKRYAQED